MTRGRALLVLLGLLLVVEAPAASSPRPLAALMQELDIAAVPPQGAPALAVSTLDGRRFTLADVKGRAALVYFWATW